MGSCCRGSRTSCSVGLPQQAAGAFCISDHKRSAISDMPRTGHHGDTEKFRETKHIAFSCLAIRSPCNRRHDTQIVNVFDQDHDYTLLNAAPMPELPTTSSGRRSSSCRMSPRSATFGTSVVSFSGKAELRNSAFAYRGKRPRNAVRTRTLVGRVPCLTVDQRLSPSCDRAQVQPPRAAVACQRIARFLPRGQGGDPRLLPLVHARASHTAPLTPATHTAPPHAPLRVHSFYS